MKLAACGAEKHDSRAIAGQLCEALCSRARRPRRERVLIRSGQRERAPFESTAACVAAMASASTVRVELEAGPVLLCRQRAADDEHVPPPLPTSAARAYSSTFVTPSPLNDSTGACVTSVYSFSFASSSSFFFRARRTRTRRCTALMPCDQRCLLSFTSMRTSFVPIIFSAKALTSLTARGARFLKPTPCSRLCRWIVYSRDTTSCERAIFSLPFAIATRVPSPAT
mmetsp:Transcript_24996/g.64501  ORF Transcript_24996/g.64501 Transcript_24996/m.64501 type:complete len:226 (-) Transcript_24996:9-686(-)